MECWWICAPGGQEGTWNLRGGVLLCCDRPVIESLHWGLLSGLKDKQCFEFFCRLKQRLWSWKKAKRKELCRESMPYGRLVLSQYFDLALMPCTCHRAWPTCYSFSPSMNKPGLEERFQLMFTFSSQENCGLPGRSKKSDYHGCVGMWSMHDVTSWSRITGSIDHVLHRQPVHREWLFIQDFWVVAHCYIFMSC